MRIFTAINLDNETKKKLKEKQERIKEIVDFPISWTDENNFHITLLFLGSLRKEELENILKETEKKAKEFSPFSFSFDKITYFSKEAPKMIWAKGKISKEIEELSIKGIIPHVTLGRIKREAIETLSREDLPEIEKEIDISFNVSSIEIMESNLRKGKAIHKVIASFPFKKI
ncbi:MAG: RNA 2',3'-cyclic phosphodiesterase [Candidatus Pacebacteria bacterium]|nr:RNA 2',3'-cyclic phosphodiesterase [Candidatus Paceibacterota bacterium]